MPVGIGQMYVSIWFDRRNLRLSFVFEQNFVEHRMTIFSLIMGHTLVLSATPVLGAWGSFLQINVPGNRQRFLEVHTT